MEEDIKILEHIAIAYKDDEKINGSLVSISTSTLITNGELAQAIENILNRLEQLEKEKAELERMLRHRIKYSQELEEDLVENCSNYVVPKSVIREKIEELEKEIKDYQCEENKINLYQRKVLKELLGEE